MGLNEQDIHYLVKRWGKHGRPTLAKIMMFSKAGIPEEYWPYTLDTYIKAGGDIEAAHKCRDYCKNIARFKDEGVGPLFWSEMKGTGKTTLSIMVLKAALQAGYSARFYPVAELLDDIMDGFKDQATGRQVKSAVENTEFLALDDLGKERRGWKGSMEELTINRLDTILRKRQGSLRVTLGSTNMTLGEVKEGYGDSVFSMFRKTIYPIEVKVESDMRQGHSKKVWDAVMNDKKEGKK